MSQDVVIVGPRPAQVNIRWHQGDTIGARLNFVDGNGDPIDLSGYSFIAQYAPDGRSQDRYSFTINTDSAGAGTLEITPPPDLDIAQKGSWDLRQVLGMDVIRTLIEGDAFAMETVSRLP